MNFKYRLTEINKITLINIEDGKLEKESKTLPISV